MNFELHQTQFIVDYTRLAEVLEFYLKNIAEQGKLYLFFDEIQEVEGWEKLINSYLANDKLDVEIFITGSNANLLSIELATYLTGRYVEINIYPFSFHEFCDYQKNQVDRPALIKYIESSGIPELFSLQERNQKIAYLTALKDSILMKDIINRHQIKAPKLLMLLLEFFIDNISHLMSLNSITKKLKSMNIKTNTVTVSNYVQFLEQSLLIHSIPRYDARGKKILEGERKYYLNDLGFNNYFSSSFESGINTKLENFVFLSLLQQGYKVYTGNIHNLEIDFVAERDQQVIYIQVSYLLAHESVIEREYKSLNQLKDHWPKYVVTLDDVQFPPKNGILHVQAWKLQSIL